MGRVLITGTFGFVGTNLLDHVAGRGHEVWALDVEAAARAAPGCARHVSRVFTWDALDQIPWREIGAVVHLAGKAHDTKNVSAPQSYFDINAGLTERIVSRLAAAAPARPAPFILFSSVKAAADSVAGVLTEDAAPDPQTPYGRSKLEAERLVREAAASRPEALAAYLLRPCMIHGPGNKGNLNLLYSVVRRGVPWPLGAFDNRRSFAAIANVCAVVERLLVGGVAPGVYQIADDEALSTNELVTLMAESLDRPARVWNVPSAWVRCAARCGDVWRLPFNSERLQKLTASYVVSNQKIKAALGWGRMPVSAREGMRLTLAGFAAAARDVGA